MLELCLLICIALLVPSLHEAQQTMHLHSVLVSIQVNLHIDHFSEKPNKAAQLQVKMITLIFLKVNLSYKRNIPARGAFYSYEQGNLFSASLSFHFSGYSPVQLHPHSMSPPQSTLEPLLLSMREASGCTCSEGHLYGDPTSYQVHSCGSEGPPE